MSNRLRRATALLAATVTVMIASAIVPEAASARPTNCRAGLVTPSKAWGTCDVGSVGWQEFRLTVQCWWWGANTVYGFPGAYGPVYTYDTCPPWSHVTSIYIGPA